MEGRETAGAEQTWGRVQQARCCRTPACVCQRVHVQTRACASSLLPMARAQARLQHWKAAARLLRPLPPAPSEEAVWAVLLSPPVGLRSDSLWTQRPHLASAHGRAGAPLLPGPPPTASSLLRSSAFSRMLCSWNHTAAFQMGFSHFLVCF